MIYVALAEAVLLLVAFLLAARQQRAHERFVYDLQERWHTERSELLNRIQRPEFLPPPRAQGPRPEPREPDGLHQVGRVLSFESRGEDGEAG